MKLLKLIPAAAIVLTAFTTFEGKAELHCLKNDGAYVARVSVKNKTSGGTKTSSSFNNPSSKCIKLSNFVDEGDQFHVYLTVIDGGTAAYTAGTRDCSQNLTRSSASSGKTYNYHATGTTDSTGLNEYKCMSNYSSYP
jgi:hypothetical protein